MECNRCCEQRQLQHHIVPCIHPDLATTRTALQVQLQAQAAYKLLALRATNTNTLLHTWSMYKHVANALLDTAGLNCCSSQANWLVLAAKATARTINHWGTLPTNTTLEPKTMHQHLYSQIMHHMKATLILQQSRRRPLLCQSGYPTNPHHPSHQHPCKPNTARCHSGTTLLTIPERVKTTSSQNEHDECTEWNEARLATQARKHACRLTQTGSLGAGLSGIHDTLAVYHQMRTR